MKYSINEQLDKISFLIKNIENKEIVIILLNEMLNIKLIDFKYQGIRKLKKLLEYDFYVIKILCETKSKKLEVYIRIIRGGEIKKSVFCCWSLLQEEYENKIKRTNDFKRIQNKINKVSIKEKTIKDYNNSISLALKGDINYNFEVNFIELDKFLKKYRSEFMDKLSTIRLNDKDILLLMVKYI